MLPKSYKQHFIDIIHLSQATENEESCFLHDIIAITNLFKHNVYILKKATHKENRSDNSNESCL